MIKIMFVTGKAISLFFMYGLISKEYAFSPPAQAIELESGEFKEVTFQATRVAYRFHLVIHPNCPYYHLS